MKDYNCDLHYHSPYSGGVSKNMEIPLLAEQAKLKGLHILATADILHGDWNNHVKKNLVEDTNGIYTDKQYGIDFIISTEVVCSDRVHHCIYFPDFSSAETFKEQLKTKAKFDSWGCGRPLIHVKPEELAQKVIDAGGILGPAHAFTPYYSIYAHFNSFEECYKNMADKISFLELGLSADSFYADLIEKHHSKSFLTSSDSHSPWPHRLGREFTRMELKEPSFKEIKHSLEHPQEERIRLNVGLNPQEGKYHLTACNQCFTKYSLKKAKNLNWKCLNCNGQIKKGVKDRILELSDFETETHPKFRPDYLHILPLSEIIQIATNTKGIQTKKIQDIWKNFVDVFETEINVLIKTPIIELNELDENVAKKIEAFRQKRVLYIPGGGGQYGKPIICDTQKEYEIKKVELEEKIKNEQNFVQKNLGDFENHLT